MKATHRLVHKEMGDEFLIHLKGTGEMWWIATLEEDRYVYDDEPILGNTRMEYWEEAGWGLIKLSTRRQA